MGYDLHITRANDWMESETNPITKEEWERYVAGSNSLQPSPDDADSIYFAGIEENCLWWDNGYVHTKSPSTAMVKKMVEIAVALDAKVQGDDGEFYLPDGRVYEKEYKIFWLSKNILFRILCRILASHILAFFHGSDGFIGADGCIYKPTGRLTPTGSQWLE